MLEDILKRAEARMTVRLGHSEKGRVERMKGMNRLQAAGEAAGKLGAALIAVFGFCLILTFILSFLPPEIRH